MKRLISILFFLILFLLSGCEKNDLQSQKLIFDNNKVLVLQKGEWFSYNRKTKKFTDYEVKEEKGISILVENKLFYLVNEKYEKVFSQGYQYLVEDRETGLFWAVENNLVGLINSKGNIIAEFKYLNYFKTNTIGEVNCFFSEGYAVVKVSNDKFGILDTKGNLVEIEGEYDSASGFRNGFGIVSNKNGKKGLFNTEGKVIVPVEYSAFNFSKYNDKFILADKFDEGFVFNDKGEMVFKFKHSISNYLVINQKNIIYKQNNTVSFYTLDGKFTNESIEVANRTHLFEFDDYLIIMEVIDEVYNEEYSKITIYNGAKKLVTFEIDVVMNSPIFIAIPSIIFSLEEENNLKIFYTDKDTLYSFSEKEGKLESVKLSKQYTLVDYYNGLLVVRENMTRGLINLKGDVILDCNYITIDIYDDGIVAQNNYYKYGIYDVEGNEILPEEYSEIVTFRNREKCTYYLDDDRFY
ncbi:MAG TPA: WG repeat-containing protein [Acholeplasmataceae bacterium]|nr:WG repeat-containing protein [Acholeplasmataceae bacterium]